jgi:hypothetical protein
MWKCRHCGETVEHNLDLCWNCGYSAQGKPPEAPELFAEVERNHLEEQSPQTFQDVGTEKRRKGHPRWEYCAVVGITKGQRGQERYNPAIWYFTSDGIKVVEVTGMEIAGVARAIARLGEEGWEMCGSGAMSDRLSQSLNPNALFFKRSKR